MSVDAPGDRRLRRFSKKLAARICARLAAGESLRAICRDPKMPHRSTVIDWVDRGEAAPQGRFGAFAQRFGQARRRGEEDLLELMLEIADEAGEAEPFKRSRLRIETLKWRIARTAGRAAAAAATAAEPAAPAPSYEQLLERLEA